MTSLDIHALLPHRPPFLWVERIISLTTGTIICETTFPPDLDFFAGHYPGHPVVPGVILCEAIFQAGVILMNLERGTAADSIPLLSRISSAKFRKPVLPGDTVRIETTVVERLSTAWYFKGSLAVTGKTALQVQFSCTSTTTD